jgi:hypothetical protein
MHSYFAHGLAIDSEIELPDLNPGSAVEGHGRRVEIRIGPRPNETHCPKSNWLVDSEGLGFAVRSGRQILVEPFGEEQRDRVGLYGAGSCLGAALIQNGCLPLHANALVWKSKALLVAGRSGAGKSTLTAHLLRSQGVQLLSDDLCCVEERNASALVWPGPQRLRLWADALNLLKIDYSGLARVHPDCEKFVVPWPGTQEISEAGWLVIVQRRPELKMERLRGLSAMEALAGQIYKAGLDDLNQWFPHILPQLATLVRTVPIYLLSRPPKVDPREAAAEIWKVLEH